MEKTFSQLAAEMEKRNSDIKSLTNALNALAGRAEIVAKQQKRGITVRDEQFETDFRAAGVKTRETAALVEDFWGAASAAARRGCGAGRDCDELGARELASALRQSGHAVSGLASAFQYLQNRSAGITMRLNWLEMETGTETLSRLCPKMAVAARELSKLSDRASLSERTRLT
ncbi:MAG: hypothetical protein WC421_00385 [Elusimicrobiales bacterium]